MELKNKWRRVWKRMKERRRRETTLDTTALLMKREFHSSAQETVGQWSNDEDCKTIRFFTDQVSEKQIDR